MGDVLFTPPTLPDRPRSGVRAAVRRVGYWLLSVLHWDDRPTAAGYREAWGRALAAESELLVIKGELAAARAEADAAKLEVRILAGVCTRNEERVKAEVSRATADRERAVNEAAGSRSTRG